MLDPILDLNRFDLVRERAEKLTDLALLIKDIRLFNEDLRELAGEIDQARKAGNSAQQVWKEQRMQVKMAYLSLKRNALEEKSRDEAEYLLAARAVVQQFLADFKAPG